MSSFSKFCSEQRESKNENNSQEERIKQTYEDLKDLNQDELSKKLYEEVKKQKNEGVFDYDTLRENVERLKPFIPIETYENMKNMLEKIK